MSRRLMRDGRTPMLGNLDMNGYRVVGAADASGDGDYVTLRQLMALLDSITEVPVGSLVLMTGTQSVPGHVRADGQSLLRDAWPDLWAYAQASGNIAASQGAKTDGQYGPGDGSTTFTVPKIIEFVRGLPSSGRTIGSTQTAQVLQHGHAATAIFAGDPLLPHAHSYLTGSTGGLQGPYNQGSESGTNRPLSTGGTSAGTPSGTVSVTVNNSGGSENRPTNIAYPYWIKAA